MTTAVWIILGAVVYLLVFIVALALCRAAARGDRQTIDYGDD